ncbi:hypothetical protein ACFX1X_036261 [Malus domestica]
MPCKILSLNSPYQILFGVAPRLQELKVFGSAVYPYVKPYNENKLQPRAVLCVFLGYAHGYKGVICYHPQSRKLIISRHVIHNEDLFPCKINSAIFTDQSQGVSYTQEANSHRSSAPFVLPVPSSNATIISDNVNMSHSNEVQLSGSESTIPVVQSHFQGSRTAFDSSASSPQSKTTLLAPQTASVLPVLHLAQLEVILPFDPSTFGNISHCDTHPHRMQTRLQTGAISQKDYSSYIASLPELSTLRLDDMDTSHNGFSFMAHINDSAEPTSFRSAATNTHWQNTMQEEYDAFRSQGTWNLVPPPTDKAVIRSKWVYKLKKNPDGSISRYKARLVAQGYSQEHGLDYFETFSHVVRHTTVRLILSLAAQQKWELRQLDIKKAFLHGDLEEEVYIHQPQGFIDPHYPHHVCKLVKSLYSLKQAPRAWNAKFNGYLPAMGFTMSQSDTSLFVKYDGVDVITLLLYVDDIILTGYNLAKIQSVITELGDVFDLKDMGRLSYFLGLQITYKSNGDIFLSQTKYAKDLLHKAGMDNCKSVNTPCRPHSQFLDSEGIPLPDPTIYRSIVGALQYLTFTQPDLAYAVNTACQYIHTPIEVHYDLVKRILCYVQSSLDYGLTYSSSSDLSLVAFSDSDWAADPNTRRFVTGFVVYLAYNPISWQFKKQASVSRSSTEAEYKSIAHCAADITWIRNLLKDLHQFLPDPPLIHCDNLSALALCSNPVFHTRIKHLDTDFHFVREKVQQNDILVQYVPTEEQTTDILTKGLHIPVFFKHCCNLRLGSPAKIEGG